MGCNLDAFCYLVQRPIFLVHEIITTSKHCLECCSGEDMERYGVQTILDLRRMDRPCKKKGKKIDQIRLAGRYVQKVCLTLPTPQSFTSVGRRFS